MQWTDPSPSGLYSAFFPQSKNSGVTRNNPKNSKENKNKMNVHQLG
jgi:hypothetical protein